MTTDVAGGFDNINKNRLLYMMGNGTCDPELMR